MLLEGINTTDLVIVSGKVVMYALITAALAYIYSTKRKGFFLFIVSFALFTLTRATYVATLITDISSLYYLTIYYFAIAFLAIGALLYNQKVNVVSVGLLAAGLFSIGVNFLPEVLTRPAINTYSVILHLIIIVSFLKQKNKNVGDVLIIFGLGVSTFWMLLTFFHPSLFEGEAILKKVTGQFIRASGGLGLTIGLLLRIILEHKHELRLLTLKDDLTNLANRRALNIYVDKLISSETPFKLALIRIRGIRQINEHYGHQAGDEALHNICKQVNLCLINEEISEGDGGYLARLNGSYLVFINFDKSKSASIEALLSKCIEQNTYKNTHLQVGIADYPNHGSHFVEILTAAEIILTESKAENTSSLHQINSSKLEVYRYQQELAKALLIAIENEDIEVHYQPKYTLIDGIVADGLTQPVLIGAEALARWSYQGKVISPFIFIQLAEEYDFIADLDALIMKKAWLKASLLEEKGCSLKIAVNYSSTSMANTDQLVGLVCQLIDSHQLNPALLEIEITESAMAQSGNTNEQLQKLRQLGISIAIDDFGTGYSNLSQLQALPLDTIKIDKVFVDLIETTPMVTEFIIEMAHKLKLNIVAEGVEQQSQLNWLTARGCQQIQGYLLSKPLTEDSFVKLVTKS
jgi:diguanylate cyclase (GGDEF)-like protein